MDDNLTKIIQYFTDWAELKIKIHFNVNPHAVYSKERQIW